MFRVSRWDVDLWSFANKLIIGVDSVRQNCPQYRSSEALDARYYYRFKHIKYVLSAHDVSRNPYKLADVIESYAVESSLAYGLDCVTGSLDFISDLDYAFREVRLDVSLRVRSNKLGHLLKILPSRVEVANLVDNVEVEK